MEEHLKTLTLLFASAAELSAAVVIGLAIVEAAVRAVVAFSRQRPIAEPNPSSHNEKERIRLRLGRWLALGLEFLLAADILQTAVAPTWDEIGKLAAVIVLRTALNFFLQMEIDKAAERERRDDPSVRTGAPAPS